MDCRCLLLFLCFLAGCPEARPPAPVVEDSPYYPLQVGNQWTYRGPEHERTIAVKKHTMMGGKPAALIETRVEGKVVAVEHLYADGKGLFILAIGNKPLTKPLPF